VRWFIISVHHLLAPVFPRKEILMANKEQGKNKDKDKKKKKKEKEKKK
jgi:hypothetical protein